MYRFAQSQAQLIKAPDSLYRTNLRGNPVSILRLRIPCATWSIGQAVAERIGRRPPP